MNRAPSLLRLVCATAVVAIAPSAFAQSLPAGMQGYWKITKQIHSTTHGAAVGSCAGEALGLTPSAKGSRVLLSDQMATWGASSAQNPDPKVVMMEPAEFAAQYLQITPMKALGLSPAAKIEVIRLGSPGNLPFDTIVVKSPSTVLFEKCGRFTEAVHSSGFVAPALPQPE